MPKRSRYKVDLNAETRLLLEKLQVATSKLDRPSSKVAVVAHAIRTMAKRYKVD